MLGTMATVLHAQHARRARIMPPKPTPAQATPPQTRPCANVTQDTTATALPATLALVLQKHKSSPTAHLAA